MNNDFIALAARAAVKKANEPKRIAIDTDATLRAYAVLCARKHASDYGRKEAAMPAFLSKAGRMIGGAAKAGYKGFKAGTGSKAGTLAALGSLVKGTGAAGGRYRAGLNASRNIGAHIGRNKGLYGAGTGLVAGTAIGASGSPSIKKAPEGYNWGEDFGGSLQKWIADNPAAAAAIIGAAGFAGGSLLSRS